ncbi:MAG: hypothetical protein EOP51_29470, partial [Sphingobacteriales bacterium]
MNTKSSRSNTLAARLILIAGLLLLLTAESFFGYRLHELSARQEMIKADHAEVNNIAYGLLSVDQWQ